MSDICKKVYEYVNNAITKESYELCIRCPKDIYDWIYLRYNIENLSKNLYLENEFINVYIFRTEDKIDNNYICSLILSNNKQTLVIIIPDSISEETFEKEELIKIVKHIYNDIFNMININSLSMFSDIFDSASKLLCIKTIMNLISFNEKYFKDINSIYEYIHGHKSKYSNDDLNEIISEEVSMIFDNGKILLYK